MNKLETLKVEFTNSLTQLFYHTRQTKRQCVQTNLIPYWEVMFPQLVKSPNIEVPRQKFYNLNIYYNPSAATTSNITKGISGECI